MSVQTEIERIKSNVANTYSALAEYGADMPEIQNSDALAETTGTVKAVLFQAQTLTDDQKAQARANIGCTSETDVEEIIAEHFGESEATVNIMDGVAWHLGYYTGSGGINSAVSSANYYSGYSDAVDVTPGETLQMTYELPLNCSGSMWCALTYWGEDGNFMSRPSAPLGWKGQTATTAIYGGTITVPDGAHKMAVNARAFTKGEQQAPDADATDADVTNLATMITVEGVRKMPSALALPEVSEADNGSVLAVSGGAWAKKRIFANIKAINHRGYNYSAPENTLSAYRLSHKMGFLYCECDVAFTSDGVAVLLHDTTVDRTSNGSGNIAEMTLETARTLDFGSWKSADYAGEQIPTFEEFVLLCKGVGIHPYIHILNETTEAQAQGLVATVKRNGMRGNVTWICTNYSVLGYIKTADESARLGVVSNTANVNHVTAAVNLKTDKNEVFVDIEYGALTDAFISECIENDVPLEVWTINSATDMIALDPYVSGYTSDILLATATMYDAYA